MPLRTTSSEEMPSVNLTSMIDVLFLLIIFFMVGTRFTQGERQIELNLPRVGELRSMATPPDQQIIAVTERGQYLFNNRPVSLQQLTQELSGMVSRYPALQVAVKADGTVQYQLVANALAAAQNAGVKKIAAAANSAYR
jgi:biopolymer transport protein ExbD